MLRQTWIYVPQVMLTHTWLQSTLLFPSEVRTVFCTNRYLKMCHKFVFYAVQSCANVDMRNYVMFVCADRESTCLGMETRETWSRSRPNLCVFAFPSWLHLMSFKTSAEGLELRLGWCLLSKPKPWIHPPGIYRINCVWHMPVIPALWKSGQDEQKKFKGLIGSIECWSAARATQDSSSINKKI